MTLNNSKLLTYRIYEELLHINKKKMDSPIEKWVRDLNMTEMNMTRCSTLLVKNTKAQ